MPNVLFSIILIVFAVSPVFAQSGHYLGHSGSRAYNHNSTSNFYGHSQRPYNHNSATNSYGHNQKPYNSHSTINRHYQGAYNSHSTINRHSTNAHGSYNHRSHYKGGLNHNFYDQDSIFSHYGRYGSPYSSDSIHNPYGSGNTYGHDSPSNPFGHGLTIFED